MLRLLLLASVICAIPTSAFAEHCSAPYAPDVVAVSASTTQKQMQQLHDDVQAFIAASDIYQECLTKASLPGVKAQLDANQREKERVGSAFNAAVTQFAKSSAKVTASN